MKKVLILLTLFLLTACGTTYTTISQNEAQDLIEKGATIIDVRTSSEYEEGHIDNAINIPLDSIDTIDLDTETTIIVYCASGVRSAEASKKLISKGYKNIYNLDGGLINWGFSE